MEEIIFPNQIRMHRRLRGMPMQELADRLGVSLSAISKIEKGYRRLNQEQLIQVAELLDCSLQDLYVNEQNTQQDVVQAWKHEQERRSKINQTAGLKTLGAGLRHIRTNKGLTLIEIAEHADMTLSVYHRIEMGQREVSEKEYRNIAKALDTTVEELKTSIQKLDTTGVLEDIIEHNDTRYKVLNNARYANLGVNTDGDIMIPLLGNANAEGNIEVERGGAYKETECPSSLRNKRGVYAVNLCSRRLGSLLSNRCVLFLDPDEVISSGDIALFYVNENEAKLLSIREDENGQLYGVQWNPDEKTNLSNSDLTKMHKVAVIKL